MQKELQDFEEEIASYCNVKYAIGVGNATDALEMADLRFMIQELSESNVWRVMKTIKGADPEGLHTDLLDRRKQN